MNSAYRQGFIDKCAEYGLEPERLVKTAGKGSLAKNIMRLSDTALSRLGGNSAYGRDLLAAKKRGFGLVSDGWKQVEVPEAFGTDAGITGLDYTRMIPAMREVWTRIPLIKYLKQEIRAAARRMPSDPLASRSPGHVLEEAARNKYR